MLGNEGGQYYNLPEGLSWSALSSFSSGDQKSYFLLFGRKANEDNEIHILETSGLETPPRTLQVYKISFCISDAKIFQINKKLILFVVGHEKPEKVGRESVFFFSEVNLFSERGQLKTNLKHKKINLFALDNIDEKVYLISDYAIYRYSLASFDFELFYEMYEKRWDYRFRGIQTDKHNRKIIATAESNLLIFDQNNNSKIVIGNLRFYKHSNKKKIAMKVH